MQERDNAISEVWHQECQVRTLFSGGRGRVARDTAHHIPEHYSNDTSHQMRSSSLVLQDFSKQTVLRDEHDSDSAQTYGPEPTRPAAVVQPAVAYCERL